MHSDHRRGGAYRQEYGGNEREILLSLESDHGERGVKRRLRKRLKSGIDLRGIRQSLIRTGDWDIADFKAPQDLILRSDTLPRNHGGKIPKKQLRETLE